MGCRFTELLLESFGYDVQSYNSGADFLADDRRRAAGCLIIDQHMPGMDGLDVVRRLQKEGVGCRRSFFGPARHEHQGTGREIGDNQRAEKPFEADCLVDLIQTALLERN